MILLYFIIFLIFIYKIYDILTLSYVNPYKLIMIFGKKGSGKTTYLTKVAIKGIKEGKKVYSTIYIPGTYVFSVDNIGKFTFEPNSIVLIDEVGMIWDNRDFKNFKPCVRDFFKYQRQYKLTVYLFSQTFDIDLKLRNLTDEMYLLSNKLRVFSVCRKIIKNITIQKGNDEHASSLVDNYEFVPFLLGGMSFTFIPRYVTFFKSYNPKSLPITSSIYYPMSDKQKLYLNNSYYTKSKICELTKSMVTFIKNKILSVTHKFEHIFICLHKINRGS